jgi:glycosyltransferase involved in cell wall biosynthesis
MMIIRTAASTNAAPSIPQVSSVLHVIPSVAPRFGGPSEAVIGMVAALARRGLRTAVFSTNLNDQGTLVPFRSPQTLNVPAVSRQMTDGVELRWFEASWPSRAYISPSMLRALRAEVRNYDLVHIHSFFNPTCIAAGSISYGRGVPYLVSPHGVLDPFVLGRHRFRKNIFQVLAGRRFIGRAAGIHYTSHQERLFAGALPGLPKGFVVPLGVDTAAFDTLPSRSEFDQANPWAKDKLLILFLGRFAAKKGLELLLTAFSNVARTIPSVHLVIAGPDDEGYTKRLADLIADAGLDARVSILGMVLGEEKRSLLGAADIWALPSYNENFGIAVVEAMAAGLPVVISDRVAIHREISDARAGLVVACDASHLASALLRFAQDPKLRRQCGDKARSLVSSTFTWDAAADRLIDVYDQVLRDLPSRNHHG